MSVPEYHNEVIFSGVRLPTVCRMFETSPTTIWRWVKSNNGFPKPIRLSGAVSVWDRAELDEWIESRKSARGQK